MTYVFVKFVLLFKGFNIEKNKFSFILLINLKVQY